jgi:hypothetical protein
MTRRQRYGLVCTILAMPVGSRGQTTDAIISGRVYDAETHTAIAGAHISCRRQGTNDEATVPSGGSGNYTLQGLSPGIYWVRAEAAGYQARETYELELFVASRVDLDVPLRQISDTYGRSLYSGGFVPSTDSIVHTYTADFTTTNSELMSVLLGTSGTLRSTLSYVIDPEQVRELPLSGRDIYTMLVALPGVTSDNATARGLGLSITGQRSSSSNFLLDGIENNDPLLTGPLTPISPDSAQEYRVSTNNYSAEFGRTGGFVANVITRSGENTFHGDFYGYLNDTVLNANSYQHIAGLNTSTAERGGQSLPRQPETELYGGFWAGGRILKDRLFWSAAYERLRSRSEGDPFPFEVPVLQRFQSCYPNSQAVALLTRFAPPIPVNNPPVTASCSMLSATFNSEIPLRFNRDLILARMDRILKDQRWLARVAVSRFSQPDFVYSVYPGFSSTLQVNSATIALGHLWTVSASANNEFRFGFGAEAHGWDRPHPEVPQLITLDSNTVTLPGSPVSYAFHYGANSPEWSDTFRLVHGPHVLAFGGGLLLRRADSLLSFRQDGLYSFATLQDFATDSPNQEQISVSRQEFPGMLQAPDFDRSYSINQFYGFAQDDFKVSRRFGISIGLRYESFGALKNTGVQDGYLQLGPGQTIEQRLAGAIPVYDNSHQLSLYRPDRKDWAPRIGLYYDIGGRGRTVMRAAYGIFYDRLFDNLTQSTSDNDIEEVTLLPPFAYPQASLKVPAGTVVIGNGVPTWLWVDQGLRTPYVQTWFGGLQRQFTDKLYGEITAQGALGRRLISNDLVNRPAPGSTSGVGTLNPNIPENIFFRSNAASSSYSAMTALARYRSRRVQFQVAYTWSHSIDNQSDPLQGTFDDLQFSRSSNVNTGDNLAAFTRQFDSQADRASSDFDQRHNLIFYSIWQSGSHTGPHWRKMLDDWQVSEIAGFRSGFPYNLITTSDLPPCPGPVGTSSDSELIRNRPSLLAGRSPFLADPVPIPGGYQVLDISSFCNPPLGVLGNLGRNSLVGPGFWNVDSSLSRSFLLPRLRDTGRVQIRADFFNIFNHANLGNPNGLAESGPGSTFGQEFLGRQGVQPSFPSAAPLDQLPRNIQLQVKVTF